MSADEPTTTIRRSKIQKPLVIFIQIRIGVWQVRYSDWVWPTFDFDLAAYVNFIPSCVEVLLNHLVLATGSFGFFLSRMTLVVVSGVQNFVTIEHRGVGVDRFHRGREVANAHDSIGWRHDRVPIGDDGRVHFGDAIEWTPVPLYGANVIEVRIGSPMSHTYMLNLDGNKVKAG